MRSPPPRHERGAGRAFHYLPRRGLHTVGTAQTDPWAWPNPAAEGLTAAETAPRADRRPCPTNAVHGPCRAARPCAEQRTSLTPALIADAHQRAVGSSAAGRARPDSPRHHDPGRHADVSPRTRRCACRAVRSFTCSHAPPFADFRPRRRPRRAAGHAPSPQSRKRRLCPSGGVGGVPPTGGPLLTGRLSPGRGPARRSRTPARRPPAPHR